KRKPLVPLHSKSRCGQPGQVYFSLLLSGLTRIIREPIVYFLPFRGKCPVKAAVWQTAFDPTAPPRNCSIQTHHWAERSTGTSSLTISAKPDGVGARCQLWIIRGEQSGLQTRIAATKSVSLCVRMKS